MRKLIGKYEQFCKPFGSILSIFEKGSKKCIDDIILLNLE